MKKHVAIITDCTCDLPDELVRKHDICLVYHYIFTHSARFRDGDEITSRNVFEYMATGSATTTDTPPLDEYIELFKENLKKAEYIIYFAMTSKMANAYELGVSAKNALGTDGGRVYIIDTKHLSTAIGHIVLNAAEMAETGRSVTEIISESEIMTDKIRCSFIVKNVDYLYKNGLVGIWLRRFCSAFNIHPVLSVNDGDMIVKRVFMGSYEKAQIKYIKSEMKDSDNINKKLLFITQAGCTVKEIATAKREVEKYCIFEKILVTDASATVSSNCGPNTIGVLYVKK